MNDVEKSQAKLHRMNIARIQLTLAGEALIYLARQESLMAELSREQLLTAALELAEDAE